MREEFINLLTAYLMSWKTLEECYEWMSGVSWDDPELASDQSLRRILGRMELLATEAVEGLRPVIQFRDEASRFVAEVTKKVYIVWAPTQGVSVSYGSSNTSSMVPQYTIIVPEMSRSGSR